MLRDGRVAWTAVFEEEGGGGVCMGKEVLFGSRKLAEGGLLANKTSCVHSGIENIDELAEGCRVTNWGCLLPDQELDLPT
jgi:hypothetical protein